MESILPKGHLGDLDRNYIWNFEKSLDSGLLGMSQAAPNPRSGKIEQNNVLMYSGNVLSYIGLQKDIAKAQREYKELKAKILAQAVAGEKSGDKKVKVPGLSANSDAGAGASTMLESRRGSRATGRAQALAKSGCEAQIAKRCAGDFRCPTQ